MCVGDMENLVSLSYQANLPETNYLLTNCLLYLSAKIEINCWTNGEVNLHEYFVSKYLLFRLCGGQPMDSDEHVSQPMNMSALFDKYAWYFKFSSF